MSSTPSQNDPAPPRSGARRLRWIVLGAAAIVAFLYFVPIPFIAYTSDAYVRSDFVEIAPQVSGVVNHVDVANDQKVAVGDLLATLDPEPFTLDVNLDQKRLDGAAAAAKVKDEEARLLASALETARAAVALTQQDYDRVAVLVKQGAVAEAVLDRSVDNRQKALDAVTGVEARLRVNAAGLSWSSSLRLRRRPSSRAISAILGSGRDAMRDPGGSGEGERRGVPRGGDLA